MPAPSPPASPSASAPGSPTGSASWSCVAIFDPTLSGGDERRAMDNIIYFWPEAAPDNLKMNHVGLCSAVAGLCETFSEAPVDSIRTDVGVTALVRPVADGEMWVAGSMSPALHASGLPHNDVALDVAADRTAAMLRTLLREAYSAFSFRFGVDALSSPPTVADFFDRFCRRGMASGSGEHHGGSKSNARQHDAMAWALGLASSHSSLAPHEYHLVRSVVAHVAPKCSSYVLASEHSVVVSTAGRDVTHACLLLLQLYGSELSSFAAFPSDVPGPQWCHVVHCGGQHAFFALCNSAMEEAITSCAADLFMLCDSLRLSRHNVLAAAMPRLRRPAAIVSLNFGSRTSYCTEAVRPGLIAALCGPVLALHDRCVPTPDGALESSATMMLRRAPLPLAPTRARPAVLGWLDEHLVDWWSLVAKDTWIVVRHGNRRTIGMLFVDSVSWSDIAESVEATAALFFHASVPFADVP